MDPRDLLAIFKHRGGTGQEREIHWGPRTIDLDIIFYGDEIIDEEDLHIPHLDMYNRTFVLGPIARIAPYKIDPRTGKSVSRTFEDWRKAAG